MDTLAEARRVANNTTRQRADTATRRAALAKLQPLDVVQVVDVETERTSAPVALWQVEETESGRVYLLSDWRRAASGLVAVERRFNADGLEVDGAGVLVPHGRMLVAVVVPAAEAHALRQGLLRRWELAVAEVAAECRAAQAARGRNLFDGAGSEGERVDTYHLQPTELDGASATSIRSAIGALALRRVQQARDTGLPGAEVEAAIQAAVRVDAALSDVPSTDREVAWVLAHLPVDVVRRALVMADAIRERFVRGERLLPEDAGGPLKQE